MKDWYRNRLKESRSHSHEAYSVVDLEPNQAGSEHDPTAELCQQVDEYDSDVGSYRYESEEPSSEDCQQMSGGVAIEEDRPTPRVLSREDRVSMVITIKGDKW